MVTPPFLKAGDTVAIIATARKISLVELQPAITLLQNNGLIVELGTNLFEIDNQFAGTDEQRFNDLQAALNNKNSNAIIVARGGYGTVKLLDKLDFTEFKKHPKWLVGYSDVTVLHSAIYNQGIATMHATMPINFTKNTQATQSLINALFGIVNEFNIKPHLLNKNGQANGLIVGGNLSLLYSLASTPYDINFDDTILFIEDLDEQLYHIDRMLMQLKLAGKLKNLKGLIVGGMTDMKDNAVPFGKTAEQIIFDAVKEYNYPVCFNFPAGHIDTNLALCFGTNTNFTVDSDGVILNKNKNDL